jgi:hypothetical protein
MKDRFDLENEIMACWDVCGDLDRAVEYIYDSHSPKTPDEIWNLFYGIKCLYEAKFSKLFDTFTEVFRLDQYRSLQEEFDDDDARMDIIGRNGNDGLHYDEI